jgi:hypothetical protein
MVGVKTEESKHSQFIQLKPKERSLFGSLVVELICVLLDDILINVTEFRVRILRGLSFLQFLRELFSLEMQISSNSHS